MNTIGLFVVLFLWVAYGHEPCDRKEMVDTICSLLQSQRKESQSGKKLQLLKLIAFIDFFISK